MNGPDGRSSLAISQEAIIRKALSDLADAATRGATRAELSMADFGREMRGINAAYASGLGALEIVTEREVSHA